MKVVMSSNIKKIEFISNKGVLNNFKSSWPYRNPGENKQIASHKKPTSDQIK